MVVHITRKISRNVATIADASAAIRTHWGRLSGKAFDGDPKAGIIEGGDAPMRVSYNGRVWAGHNKLANSAEIPTGIYGRLASESL